MSNIVSKKEIEAMRASLDESIKLMLIFGQSYKSIMDAIEGVKLSDIARVVRENNVHAWDYRNGTSQLGKAVCTRLKMLPNVNVSGYIKLFSNTQKQIQ
jgi:hypothetical protein